MEIRENAKQNKNKNKNGQQKAKERMENYVKKKKQTKELHSWVYLFIVFILSVNKTKFITA